MASRIIHLAIANALIQRRPFRDANRFRFGCILPDSGSDKNSSHYRIRLANGQHGYDLTGYLDRFQNRVQNDELYLGYYIHLVQDKLFRQLLYGKYDWDPHKPHYVDRLHNDYKIINRWITDHYHLQNDLRLPDAFDREEIHAIGPFDGRRLLLELAEDFSNQADGETFFMTPALAEEFISLSTDICLKELPSAAAGHFGDPALPLQYL